MGAALGRPCGGGSAWDDSAGAGGDGLSPTRSDVRGVSLDVLRELGGWAASRQAVAGTWVRPWTGEVRPAGEPLTTTDVCHEIVMPMTARERASYVSTLPKPRTRKADVFVIHAWSYHFTDVVAALEETVGEDEGMWLCVLTHNQWLERLPDGYLQRQFGRTIDAAERTVVLHWPWSRPVVLERAWCILELAESFMRSKPVTMHMPPRERAHFNDALAEHFSELLRAVSDVSLPRASASAPADAERIAEHVEGGVAGGARQLEVHAQDVVRACLASEAEALLAARPTDAKLRRSIAQLARAQGRLDSAEELLREGTRHVGAHVAALSALPCVPHALAVALVRCAGIRADADALGSLNELASVLHAKGQLAEAAQVHSRALEAAERALGPEHPRTLASVSNLAAVLHARGRLEEASVLLRRALDAEERTSGPDHRRTLGAASELGVVLHDLGRHDESAELQRRAITGMSRTLGPEHPDTLNAVNNLAQLFCAQGKLAKAEELQRRVLAASERTLGAEHPGTLTALNNLAAVLLAKGQVAECAELHRRVLETRERALGAEHADTLVSVNNLAAVLRTQGELDASTKLHRRALDARLRTLGPEHPDTLVSTHNLATSLREKGENEKAIGLYRKALEVKERSLGRDHPSTISTVGSLAATLFSAGQHAEAEALLRRALAASERDLGPEHADTLNLANTLAEALRHGHKLGEAVALHRRTLGARERTLGRDDSHVLLTVNNLAVALHDQGELDEAAALFKRAAEGWHLKYGADDPRTRAARASLARVSSLSTQLWGVSPARA